MLTQRHKHQMAFQKFFIQTPPEIFQRLCAQTDFEDITRGRLGAILVELTDNDLIPIVRTTSKYTKPAECFSEVHYEIIQKIQEKFPDIKFNNAMIEIYDCTYRKMGFHTDQSLDLADDSYICLFSCYEKGSDDLRKLHIKSKRTSEITEVLLEENSCVIFSTLENSLKQHKIILDSMRPSLNRWLGITFRLSKTFVQFIHGEAYLQFSNKLLKIATQEQQVEFYKMKSQENRHNGRFVYPNIDYTLSISDTMLPI